MTKMDKKAAWNGKLLLITAPSGAGKTTIVRHLLKKYNENFSFSVSATTREKRAHEVDGIDYYFITKEEFKERIQNGAFLEWEEVYEDQYYGTLKSEIHRIWQQGKHIIFDIEVKGAKNIMTQFAAETLSAFIRPPSLKILIERLIGRNTESEASLNKRIARVTEEMTYEKYFDYVIVNDLLEVALEEAEYIVEEKILNLACAKAEEE